MAARTRISPSGICRKTASTASWYHEAKNPTFFLPGKTHGLCLQGRYPLTPCLAPDRSAKDSAGNGNMFINARPMAAFTKGEFQI